MPPTNVSNIKLQSIPLLIVIILSQGGIKDKLFSRMKKMGEIRDTLKGGAGTD